MRAWAPFCEAARRAGNCCSVCAVGLANLRMQVWSFRQDPWGNAGDVGIMNPCRFKMNLEARLLLATTAPLTPSSPSWPWQFCPVWWEWQSVPPSWAETAGPRGFTRFNAFTVQSEMRRNYLGCLMTKHLSLRSLCLYGDSIKCDRKKINDAWAWVPPKWSVPGVLEYSAASTKSENR